MPGIQSCKNHFILMSHFEGLVQTACSHHGPSAKWSVHLIFTSAVASRLVISCTGYCVEWVRKKMVISIHCIQSMSGHKAMSVKKQQKPKYNLCKHQFRGNLKIKNSWITSKGLVGIEINLSQKNLLSFLDHKLLPELLKNFFLYLIYCRD